MKRSAIIIFFLALFALQGSAQTEDTTTRYQYSVGLQLGAWKGYVFDDFSFSPSLQVEWNNRFLDIGLIGGFRYRAHGDEWYDNAPDNLHEASERPGQYNNPAGDMALTYRTSRFFQSYLHLYLNKTVLSLGSFDLNLGLSPGFEYADHIAPISAETVHFENGRPEGGQYVLYEVAYKRFLAFGVIGKIDATYNMGNKYIAAGYERSHYFEGNRYNNLFVRLGVRFN